MENSPQTQFHLFQTTLGWCGIAWSQQGICRILLPDPSEEKVRAVMSRFLKTRPQAFEVKRCGEPVRSWVRLIQDYLRRPGILLDALPLDLHTVPEFHRQVYARAQSIPRGHVVTYGELARQTGSPGAARAVGQAMARNPFPLIVPCHRVVGAAGLGGFSATQGLKLKVQLLQREASPI